MGGYIEINDTLQITTEQGFPEDILNLKNQQNNIIKFENIKDKIFEFKNKKNARVFHPAPNRVFLVHNINGKWIYWGKIIMIEQTIKLINNEYFTSGKYKIIKIYDKEYQKEITKNETNIGENYFE